MQGLSEARRLFRCALGLTLTPADAPKLTALLARANADAGAAANRIKMRYQHKRPFQVAEGDVCVSALGKAALERSPDYPSGHAALSWETGLILAKLVPEAASEVLARARAFGQNQIVCGVHNASAVEAGWMTAPSVFAMEAGSVEFHKDFGAARTELTALRAHANQNRQVAMRKPKPFRRILIEGNSLSSRAATPIRRSPEPP